jgi:hypothetical protein
VDATRADTQKKMLHYYLSVRSCCTFFSSFIPLFFFSHSQSQQEKQQRSNSTIISETFLYIYCLNLSIKETSLLKMPADHCGNPLLRDWVKEWMDHAQGLPGNKSYYTYKKVNISLNTVALNFGSSYAVYRLTNH